MAIIEPFAITIGFLLAYLFGFMKSYGFSIIVLTIIINIIIFPLTHRQTRSTKRMQDAQPEMKKLQKEHRDNKEELNKAVAELYKEKGINPLGCILPLLVQMPVWFALFRVLREPLVFVPLESDLSVFLENVTRPLFYNMDLQIPPSEVSGWVERIPYLVLILAVVGTALFQQNQITKKNKPDNPQAKQMQMIGKIMPLFFGFISWTLPTGLVVYFLTGNIFRIGQQALIMSREDKDKEKEKNNTTTKEQTEEQKDDTSEDEQTNKQISRKKRKKRRRK